MKIIDFNSISHIILIFMGINLSLHDKKWLSFPLLNWLIPTLFLFYLNPINPLVMSLALLGIIAEIKDLKMGSGDFFFLASLAFVLKLQDLLWVIQLSSLAGILTFLYHKNPTKRLPFIPYLFLSYLIVLIYQKGVG
ncbi:A24 family peptidase [Streptococcus porcorum]|uniref:Prepilin signal peptidase PulO-like enzyme (Type II secretory pathway) n=1 Tax=Streptococcus porcorum TaxID=701526 RepID=A0ABV2JH24_9STRE